MGTVLQGIRAVVDPQGRQAPAMLDSLGFAQWTETRAQVFLASSKCQAPFWCGRVGGEHRSFGTCKGD